VVVRSWGSENAGEWLEDLVARDPSLEPLRLEQVHYSAADVAFDTFYARSSASVDVSLHTSQMSNDMDWELTVNSFLRECQFLWVKTLRVSRG
jgi:hypothetical protein